jgi:predicted HD superfamily hydrolase involved in NAD metabolism
MLEKIRKKIKKKLSEKRYNHILRTEEMAVKIGKGYGIDEKRLRVAALLHDYAKEEKLETLQKICKQSYGKEIENYLEMNEVLHGFAGAILAKEEFKINDEEILEAIKYHTVGKRDLSIFGKIIYMADAIEEGRDYPGVDELRKVALENLDEAILMELQQKLEYLLKKEIVIHLNTVDMRNNILELRRKK